MSWRQPSSPLGPAEEGTALPDAQPTTASTGCLCARVSPSTPNPHHPRPWHRGSLFGDGPRRPFGADERRAWLARAEAERHAGRLTALHVVVGRALLKRLGEDGRCDPAHATLATDVGCGERTVRRALGGLRDAGMLAWEQRVVRRPWPEGGPGATRAEQTSNAYAFLLPTGPIAALAPRPVQFRLPHCGGQAGRETPLKMIPIELPTFTEIERREQENRMIARKAKRDAEWMAERTERWQKWGWLPS